MRHLYIAGVDRWCDLERDTLQIEQALTYQIDTCSFHVSGVQPVEGEEVIIEDDALGRLFAGIIVKVELIDKDLKIWAVECDDYTVLLDRRLVVEAYENMSASDIFLDIVAKYCPGFTTNGVRPGAPVIESTGVEFEYKRPSECFKWLCDYIGWHWQPDYYKDLHFFSAEELANPAPMVLRPGGKFRFGKHSIDTQGLRNRVYVRGGTMLSDPQVVQWKADGVARIWALPWPPHEVSLTVGEVPQTVGVENLHDEADFDYMMSFAEKYIRCSAHTPTPVEGTTMSLTARQDIPVITMVEDYASQAAIAKVQGGDGIYKHVIDDDSLTTIHGIYEHVIDDDSLTTIQAAEAAGLADLREHANPRVKGSFETEYIVPAELEAVLIGYEDNKDVILDWELGIEQATQTGSYFLMQDASAGQRFKATAELAGAEHVRVSVLGSEKFAIPPEFIGFHIYTDDNGVPGNTISSTGFATVAGADWPNNPMEPEWVTAEISLDEPLEEGKYYWLVLITEPGYESAYVKFCTSWANPYPDGYYAARTGSGGWSIQTETDFTFKIEVPVYEQLPIYEYEVKTPAHIWQPGQVVNIRLPDRGVEGEFLVQRVTITPTWSNPSIWTFRVEYGGRLFGIADFLKALVSAQQKKRNIEPTKSIQKYVYGEETLTVGDELITATRGLPFVCGDADAVCGLVVVSNG